MYQTPPQNLGARTVTGWSHLPSDAVTKDIAPEWQGPGSREDYRKWKRDVHDWQELCSYDSERQQVKALTFRVPPGVKQIIQGFRERPTAGQPGANQPDGTPHSEWTWFWRCMDREFDRPGYEFRMGEYTAFYNLVRQRGQDLRAWLPLHTDRWNRASSQDLTMNLLVGATGF